MDLLNKKAENSFDLQGQAISRALKSELGRNQKHDQCTLEDKIRHKRIKRRLKFFGPICAICKVIRYTSSALGFMKINTSCTLPRTQMFNH